MTVKEIIQKTLLGFGLFLLSWLIIFTLLSLLSANTSMIGKGENGIFQFTCDDDSAFYISQPQGGGSTDTPPSSGGSTDTPLSGGGSVSRPPAGGGSSQEEPISTPITSHTSEQNARDDLRQQSNNQISFWHSPSGETNIKDLLPATKNEIIRFQQEISRPVIVTAGAEQGNGHSERSPYSHASGHKFDINTNGNNDPLLRYVRSNYVYVGPRADGAPLYRSPSSGAYYAIEDSHLDICADCPEPTLRH